jgi:sulfite reductase (NADPH) flavoprotein alpha-component
MIRSILFQLHWLIGITAGAVLAVVGITGAALSYEEELLAALNAGVVTLASRAQARLTPPQIVERLRVEHPQKPVVSLLWYDDPARAMRVTFAATAPTTALRPPSGQSGMRGEVRYVDPYTGRLLGGATLRGQMALHDIEQIHRNLAAGPAGKLIVGVSTLALVVLCATGLYLRWPTRPLDWRQWLQINFALRGRVFWRRLHAVFGTVALLLYLSAALSGLYFSFEWYRHAVNGVAGANPPQRGAARLDQPATGEIDLRKIWSEFERTGATYSSVNLMLPQSNDQAVELRYLSPGAAHERAFNRFIVHPVTAQVLRNQPYASQSFSNKLVSGIFPLHSGRLLGVAGTALMMVASLGMPFFAITGWILYLKRRRRAQSALLAQNQTS